MATLDATTQAEYAAEVNAADRAQVIIDALDAPVTVKVYTSEDVVAASGTMADPWATASGYALTTSTLDGFFVTEADSPNDGWYLQFESGSRYVRLSFGLSGSGKEAVWSLPSWDVGTRAGISSGVINVTGNRPPEWSGAPSTLSFIQGTGGSANFSAYASDPDADSIAYSLVGASYTGISIGATTGVLSVTSSATAAVRSLTIRATDSTGLYADHSCSVTIVAQGVGVKWNPGVYIYLSPHTDTAATRASNLAWFQNYASNSNIKGFYIQMYLSQFETGTTPVYSYTSQSGGVNYGGFAMVDYYLGLCEQYGKRLALEFETVGFGSNPLPAYWQAQNWFFINDTAYRTNTGIAACNNRLIALVQAYGARYNSHPRLEVVGFEETTVNLGTAGVSESTWINNYKALLSASVAAFPNTLVRNNENGQTSHATTKTIYEHVETLNNAGVGCVICGGPDFENGLFPPNTPYSPGSPKGWKQLWRGQTTSQGVTWKDVRGVHPFWGECQDRRYNSAYPSQLPVDSAADVCTYQIDFMRASHVTFNNYAKWTETLAAINARSGLTVTTPPSCLSGRTVTEGTGQEEIVVVTGSSTISLWSTIQSDFAPQTVIKKGVSGTTVADLQANLSSLVLQYSPTKVGIYQGDNDIAGGVTPAAFISTYRQVLQAINAQFPSCRCYAISIKPSPARTAYWETMQEANALLAAMCNEDSRWNYINASDVLLSGGVPVTAYFDPSGSPAYLHLSSAGYAVWAPVVVSGMGL